MNLVGDLIISSLSCIFSLRFLNYLSSRLGSFYLKAKPFSKYDIFVFCLAIFGLRIFNEKIWRNRFLSFGEHRVTAMCSYVEEMIYGNFENCNISE